MGIFGGYSPVAPAMMSPFGGGGAGQGGSGIGPAQKTAASQEREARLQQSAEDRNITKELLPGAAYEYNVSMSSLQNLRQHYKQKMTDIVFSSANPFEAIESDEYKKTRNDYMGVDVQEAKYKALYGVSKMYADVVKTKLNDEKWGALPAFDSSSTAIGVDEKGNLTRNWDKATRLATNAEFAVSQFGASLGENIEIPTKYDDNADQLEITALLNFAGSTTTDFETEVGRTGKDGEKWKAGESINRIITSIGRTKTNLKQLNELGGIIYQRLSPEAQKAWFAKFSLYAKGDGMLPGHLKPVFDYEDDGNIKMSKQKNAQGIEENAPVLKTYTAEDVKSGVIDPATGEKAKLGDKRFETYKIRDFSMWAGDQVAAYERGFSVIEQSTRMNVHIIGGGDGKDDAPPMNYPAMIAGGVNPWKIAGQAATRLAMSTGKPTTANLGHINKFDDLIAGTSADDMTDAVKTIYSNFNPETAGKLKGLLDYYYKVSPNDQTVVAAMKEAGMYDAEGRKKDDYDYKDYRKYVAHLMSTTVNNDAQVASGNRKEIDNYLKVTKEDVPDESYGTKQTANLRFGHGVNAYREELLAERKNTPVANTSYGIQQTAQKIIDNSGVPVVMTDIYDNYLIDFPTHARQNLIGQNVLLPGQAYNSPIKLPSNAIVVAVTNAVQIGDKIVPGVMTLMSKEDMKALKVKMNFDGKVQELSYWELRNKVEFGMTEFDDTNPAQLQYLDVLSRVPAAAKANIEYKNYYLVPFIVDSEWFLGDSVLEAGEKKVHF